MQVPWPFWLWVETIFTFEQKLRFFFQADNQHGAKGQSKAPVDFFAFDKNLSGKTDGIAGGKRN